MHSASPVLNDSREKLAPAIRNAPIRVNGAAQATVTPGLWFNTAQASIGVMIVAVLIRKLHW